MTEDFRQLDLAGHDAVQPTAKEAAEAIYEIAVSHGLLSVGEGPPAEVDDDAIDEDEGTQAATRFEQQAVLEVFRKRPIKLITYDDQNRVVTILTDKPVGVRQRKLLPAGLHGTINIQYIASGSPEVRGTDNGNFSAQPFWQHNNRYCCGSSVFPANRLGAGTFGALVRSQDGQMLGLTNNHVTGGCNHSEPGLPILAPGPADVRASPLHPFTIGLHHSLRPIHDGHPSQINISDNVDLALFSIIDENLVTSMQGNSYDTPADIASLAGGMRVEKIGRTTSRTFGTVLGPSVAPIQVYYDVREYGIRKFVYFPGDHVFAVQGDAGNLFSSPGDSGALVTTLLPDGNRRAVGLVFAGNEKTRISFVLPLEGILGQLGLTLVSGHGL